MPLRAWPPTRRAIVQRDGVGGERRRRRPDVHVPGRRGRRRSGGSWPARCHEVTVACDGDYFIQAKKRMKVWRCKRHGGEPIAVVLEPDARGVGVSTTLGRGRGGGGPTAWR